MKLIEAFSLVGGQAIDKIDIFEQYFPLNIDKYIVLHGTSKGSKTYDLWNDVIDILKPILDKNNISIIAIGGKDDKPIKHTINLCGQTTYNQVAYLIKHCELLLGVDSFSQHLAGAFDKKIVCLFGNNYKKVSFSYFGDPNNQVVLEPDRKGNKPCFAYEEHPKTINEIKVEDVAAAVCKLLNLPFNHPYKTLFVGQNYLNKTLELVPDQVIDPSALKLNTLIIRMDYLFDEEKMFKQLQVCNGVIVTNKEINNKELLLRFRPRVHEIIVVVESEEQLKFLEFLYENKFKFRLISFLPPEDIHKLKIHYMEYGTINYHSKHDWKELFKDKDLSKLYYKSNKFLLAGGKIYQSKNDYLRGINIPNFETQFLQLVDSEHVEDEINDFFVVEKIC